MSKRSFNDIDLDLELHEDAILMNGTRGKITAILIYLFLNNLFVLPSFALLFVDSIRTHHLWPLVSSSRSRRRVSHSLSSLLLWAFHFRLLPCRLFWCSASRLSYRTVPSLPRSSEPPLHSFSSPLMLTFTYLVSCFALLHFSPLAPLWPSGSWLVFSVSLWALVLGLGFRLISLSWLSLSP